MNNELEIERGNGLIESFINGTIVAEVFEIEYMSLWRNWRDNKISFDPGLQEMYDNIFVLCDAYCGSSDLRDESDLDEKQFREGVAKAYTPYPSALTETK